MTRLDEMVRTLLQDATAFIGDDAISELLGRFDEPLRIGVTGGPGVGKSTLINALLGAKVALSESSTFTWYRRGPTPSVKAGQDGQLIVTWPARALRHMTLVESSHPGDFAGDVDAVLHLGPTGKVPDSPVHSIGVLCRADEVAGGRIDALANVRRSARRLTRRPGSRTTVVAFSGRLAYAGQTLTEENFTLLVQLAAMPRAELDLAPPTSAVLELLGLHGLRLATTLIRAGHDTLVRLRDELVRRSGLTDLQDRLSYHFLERRDILKAHSALRALRPLAAEHPRLLAMIELGEADLLTAGRCEEARSADEKEGDRRDSNPRHPGPQPGALPTELRPPCANVSCETRPPMIATLRPSLSSGYAVR